MYNTIQYSFINRLDITQADIVISRQSASCKFHAKKQPAPVENVCKIVHSSYP